MGRKRTKADEATPFLIKRKLDEILNSDMQHPGKPLVLSGNDYPSGKKRREVVQVAKRNHVVTVREQIIRIQEDADPLAFLISVQRGDLIPVSFVDDDGNVCTMYQQASLKDRVDVARYLTNKVLPTLSVTKHVIESDQPDEQSDAAFDPNRPGQPSFAQLVAAAAAKRRGVSVPEQPGKMIEVEDGDEEVDHTAAVDGAGRASEE